MSWFRRAEEAPQLEDLEQVLAEGPEELPGNAPSSPGSRCLAAGGAAASPQQSLAGRAAAPQAAGAADGDPTPLPVSSGSALPALSSPEKPVVHQDASSSSAAAGGWLPSVAAWLPTRATSTLVAAGGEQQQQQDQQVAEQQDQQLVMQSSWRDYLPSSALLPLPSLLSGAGTGSAAATLAPLEGGTPAAPAAAAPPAAAAAGGSSHDSSGLLDWAAAAPHQLASAYHQAAHQLGAVGTTAVGASLLGATVGGIVAGPLGAAAGAKSGAAWVAAGALGGAAVQRLKDGSHPAEPAAQERELQAIRSSSSSPSGAGAGTAGSQEVPAAPDGRADSRPAGQ